MKISKLAIVAFLNLTPTLSHASQKAQHHDDTVDDTVDKLARDLEYKASIAPTLKLPSRKIEDEPTRNLRTRRIVGYSSSSSSTSDFSSATGEQSAISASTSATLSTGKTKHLVPPIATNLENWEKIKYRLRNNLSPLSSRSPTSAATSESESPKKTVVLSPSPQEEVSKGKSIGERIRADQEYSSEFNSLIKQSADPKNFLELRKLFFKWNPLTALDHTKTIVVSKLLNLRHPAPLQLLLSQIENGQIENAEKFIGENKDWIKVVTSTLFSELLILEEEASFLWVSWLRHTTAGQSILTELRDSQFQAHNFQHNYWLKQLNFAHMLRYGWGGSEVLLRARERYKTVMYADLEKADRRFAGLAWHFYTEMLYHGLGGLENKKEALNNWRIIYKKHEVDYSGITYIKIATTASEVAKDVKACNEGLEFFLDLYEHSGLPVAKYEAAVLQEKLARGSSLFETDVFNPTKLSTAMKWHRENWEQHGHLGSLEQYLALVSESVFDLDKDTAIQREGKEALQKYYENQSAFLQLLNQTKSR